MNRESGFFKDCYVFYDILHGYCHTCSSIYSSQPFTEFTSVNKSLCEQFNSFPQCNKASAKQISQVCFYDTYMEREKKLPLPTNSE